MPGTNKASDSVFKDNPQIDTAISILLDKKAQNIVVYDLRQLTQLFDNVIIANGLSSTQLDVIKRSLERGMRKEGIRPLGVEGDSDSGWVLLDFVDFIIHVFTPEKRDYYRLDKIWGDQPAVTIESEDKLE